MTIGEAYDAYLAREPSDAAIWIELAALHVARNRGDPAMWALRQAVEHGGEPIKERIRIDARFEPLRRFEEFKKLVAP